MGSYNAKEKIDQARLDLLKTNRKNAMVTLKKRKNMELKKYNINDSKTIIYKKFFDKQYNIKSSDEAGDDIIIPKEINNSFSFSLTKYYKFYKQSISTLTQNKINYSQINLHDPLNMSDYIDISDIPLLNPNKFKLLEPLKTQNSHNNINPLLSKSEKIRNNYYAKLIDKDIWDPTKREKRINTVFFYDWDDTLLPTSSLTSQGQLPDDIKLTEKDKDKLKSLDQTIYNILKVSVQLGDVYIVTNAAPGWVEYSCKRFYPKSFTLIDKINIKSARGKYEKKIPGDSRIWKTMTFLDVLDNININLITNLICLGDSIIEIEATHKLGEKLSNVYIKTIKFKEQPNPGELAQQLNTIAGEIKGIYSKVKNLSMRLEKKE